MRALVLGFLMAAVPFVAIAKEKPKPPASLAQMRGRSAECALNYRAELKTARSLPFETYQIEGQDVVKFLAIFNAAEPKTDFKAEQIIVSVNPKFAYLEMFVGGCVDHDGKITPGSFEEMMWRAFGGELPNATAM